MRQPTLPIFSHRPNVCLCVKLCVISMPRLTHKSREDKLVNEEQRPQSPHLPFLSLSSLPISLNTLIPLSLFLSHPSLSCFYSLLPLSPQIGPAVHQPPRSSPSCLPSPNEKPHNNTGHRSRERTGCAHNRPVAPHKTIISFFSSSLSPLLPGLEKTNLCRGS